MNDRMSLEQVNGLEAFSADDMIAINGGSEAPGTGFSRAIGHFFGELAREVVVVFIAHEIV